MINQCKNINIILTTCIPTGAPCQFMTDPQSCPEYDEESAKSFQSHPDWVDKSEGKPEPQVESVDEFVERTNSELSEIGAKTKKDEKPNRPCSICGSDEWWQRADDEWNGGWICGRCHPKPTERVPDWF